MLVHTEAEASLLHDVEHGPVPARTTGSKSAVDNNADKDTTAHTKARLVLTRIFELLSEMLLGVESEENTSARAKSLEEEMGRTVLKLLQS
jgi:hypothetical protein